MESVTGNVTSDVPYQTQTSNVSPVTASANGDINETTRVYVKKSHASVMKTRTALTSSLTLKQAKLKNNVSVKQGWKVTAAKAVTTSTNVKGMKDCAAKQPVATCLAGSYASANADLTLNSEIKHATISTSVTLGYMHVRQIKFATTKLDFMHVPAIQMTAVL